MKLSDLIQRLQDIADDCGDNDPDVQLAHQPHYPFYYDLENVVTDADIKFAHAVEDGEVDQAVDFDLAQHIMVVYLTEGAQLGYGDRAAWQQ